MFHIHFLTFMLAFLSASVRLLYLLHFSYYEIHFDLVVTKKKKKRGKLLWASFLTCYDDRKIFKFINKTFESFVQWLLNFPFHCIFLCQFNARIKILIFPIFFPLLYLSRIHWMMYAYLYEILKSSMPF